MYTHTGLAAMISSDVLLTSIIGASSAIIDNVPLVAAAMGMYGLDVHAGGYLHSYAYAHTHRYTWTGFELFFVQPTFFLLFFILFLFFIFSLQTFVFLYLFLLFSLCSRQPVLEPDCLLCWHGRQHADHRLCRWYCVYGPGKRFLLLVDACVLMHLVCVMEKMHSEK